MAKGSVKLDQKTGKYYYVVDVAQEGEPRNQKKSEDSKGKRTLTLL